MTQIDCNSVQDDDFYLPSQAGWGDYVALLKPRVMALVVFTALVGMVLAPGKIDPFLGLLAVLCIAIGGGASGALNMWYESDIDALMQRTKARPIPAGIIKPGEACVFALSLATFSVLIMGLFINWFAAFFLSFTIFFYAVIYTIFLNPSTPQNIVIGGAAGAFPPMIGWSAVTGSISLESIVLFLIIFMWTPPHFWALSLFTTTDYQAAGIPMLPNVKGVAATKNQIVLYSWIMAATGFIPYILGMAGLFYALIALILGGVFVFYAHALHRACEEARSKLAARRLFAFSLLYLTAIFTLLLCERLTVYAIGMIYG